LRVLPFLKRKLPRQQPHRIPVPHCIAPNNRVVLGQFKNAFKREVTRFCFFFAHAPISRSAISLSQ
jgi:hypothetical protein